MRNGTFSFQVVVFVSDGAPCQFGGWKSTADCLDFVMISFIISIYFTALVFVLSSCQSIKNCFSVQCLCVLVCETVRCTWRNGRACGFWTFLFCDPADCGSLQADTDIGDSADLRRRSSGQCVRACVWHFFQVKTVNTETEEETQSDLKGKKRGQDNDWIPITITLVCVRACV